MAAMIFGSARAAMTACPRALGWPPSNRSGEDFIPRLSNMTTLMPLALRAETIIATLASVSPVSCWSGTSTMTNCVPSGNRGTQPSIHTTGGVAGNAGIRDVRVYAFGFQKRFEQAG